jgi:hypothetical protein
METTCRPACWMKMVPAYQENGLRDGVRMAPELESTDRRFHTILKEEVREQHFFLE